MQAALPEESQEVQSCRYPPRAHNGPGEKALITIDHQISLGPEHQNKQCNAVLVLKALLAPLLE